MQRYEPAIEAYAGGRGGLLAAWKAALPATVEGRGGPARRRLPAGAVRHG